MTSREVAERAGVSIRAVQHAVRNGAIKATKPAHDLILDEKSALAWVASERRPGPKPKLRKEVRR